MPLLEVLRETTLFDATAIECVCEVVSRELVADFAGQKEALVHALQAELMPDPVVALLHSLIRQEVMEAIVEKLAGDLENDGPFKGVIRRD